MTNRETGEFITGVAWRGGAPVRLQLTMNALCHLEDQVNMPFTAFFAAFSAEAESGALRLGSVRALMWAAMVVHQPDASLSDAGDLIARLGGLQGAVSLLGQVAMSAMPDVVPGGAAPSGAGKPRKAGKPG
jgi:hypothetical protein